ncbi:hypothetical protein [Nafulsella turpanensis]|uniref:hypothetical protein n=1 Tax=Nafulsella turpanensis TaxID=1265690 RepID=UPI00034D009F|nr:hypothetical protein [Nafulsella turpanensis]
MNSIEQRIAEIYPHYKLADNVTILYGNSKPSEEQLVRIIARTFLEIGSFDVFNKIGPVKVDYDMLIDRVERYIDYVVLCEAVEYNLADPINLYSVQALLIRISQLFQELDGYSRFIKQDGYKGYVREERLSEGGVRDYNNLSAVLIDSLIKGIQILKGYEVNTYYQPAFHIPEKGCIGVADRFLKVLKDAQKKKEEAVIKSEVYIGFDQIRNELNIKKNETFKQYFDQLGIQIYGSKNKPTITESDYLKLHEFWKNKNK